MSDSLSVLKQLLSEISSVQTLKSLIVDNIIVIITSISGVVVAVFRFLKARQRKVLYKKLVDDSFFTEGQIANARRHYIRPRCQNVDPANTEEMRGDFATYEPLFKKMNEFIRESTQYRYIIILADSGMGKSSFMLNYYAHFMVKSKRMYSLVLLPLGIPDVDDKIKAVSDKKHTVLLLDALDEDTRAVGNHAARVHQIVELTRDFHKVVVSCRTQFFPSDEELPLRTGVLRTGPVDPAMTKEHVFHKLYLSPFSDFGDMSNAEKPAPSYQRSPISRSGPCFCHMLITLYARVRNTILPMIYTRPWSMPGLNGRKGFSGLNKKSYWNFPESLQSICF
jgi:hypothetical protein